jgi:O-antigen chain-terminating methyltransferase
VVSGFHIAEHLPFDVLQSLISEAYRVLRPGGLLILETPNAENVNVGTLSFHMDPTHNKPLPPGLLSFLPRFYGFYRHKILRLQENPSVMFSDVVALIDVFQGVSPDYAVVAQKGGDPDFLAKFESLFLADYGLTLETLTKRFENGFNSRIDELARNYHHLNDEVQVAQQQIIDLSEQNSAYLQQLIAVHESTSWRVTKPLRSARRILDLRSQLKPRLRGLIAAVLRRLVVFVLSKRSLSKVSRQFVKRFPTISGRLRALLFRNGDALSNESFRHRMIERQLSPKAAVIFAKLMARRER